MDKLHFSLLVILYILDFSCAQICREAICEYELIIRHGRTMTYRPAKGKPYEVVPNDQGQLELAETLFRRKSDPLVGTIVNSSDVITGDGVSRNIITINGMFPGPTLEVEEGAQVVVKVVNKLQTDGVTIHWHGMHHKNNVWMDGAAQITQCPIPPYQYFTYRFEASPAGTHWYHAHNGYQRLDGLSGMLIVHKKNIAPPFPVFPLMVADWFHVEGHTLEVSNPYSLDPFDKGTGGLYHTDQTIRSYMVDGVETATLGYVSGLINGRGRWKEDVKTPLARFSFEPDKTALFKMVNTGGELFFEISIDSHKLIVTALDGTDIEKFEVDSVILSPGETIDFEVRSNQSPAMYWIRARSLRDHTKDGRINEVKAIFDYAGTTADPMKEPSSTSKICTDNGPCKVLNCPFPNYPPNHNKMCYSIADMRSREELSKEYGLDDREITELFFNAGFNWGSSINGRKYFPSNAPVYQKDRQEVDCEEVCKNMNLGCVCSSTYQIPFNKTIQLVLSNVQYGEPLQSHHPMHLHGHNFAVLKIGYGVHDPITGMFMAPQQDVICANSFCRKPSWNGSRPVLNVNKPPIKNTILVPARGYAVVRFRSENPGPWLFHCHAVTHNFEGMKTLIEEGVGRYPPPPKDFPRCEQYEWTMEKFQDFQTLSQSLIRNPSKDKVYIEDMDNRLEGDSGDEMSAAKPKDVSECPGIKAKDEGSVTLKKEEFIGLIVGCICCGVVLAILVFLASSCRKDGKTSEKQTSQL